MRHAQVCRFKFIYIMSTHDSLFIPPVLYHGTNADFSDFDLRFKGSNTQWHNTIHGFFFIDTLEHAQMFGDRILQCELKIVQPINIEIHAIFSIESQASVIWEILSGEILESKMALRTLNEEIGLGEIGDLYDCLHSEDGHDLMVHYGFDGMISHFGNDQLEYVAFAVEQIKIKNSISSVSL